MAAWEALGTVAAGGGVAVFASWVTQRMQAAEAARVREATEQTAARVRAETAGHDKRMRYFDERRAAYAEFLASSKQVEQDGLFGMAGPADDAEHAEWERQEAQRKVADSNKMYLEAERIELIAPSAVSSAAREIMSLTRSMTSDGRSIEPLDRARKAFIKAARHDLGLENDEHR